MITPDRRNFLKIAAILGMGFLLPVSDTTSVFVKNIFSKVNGAIMAVIRIIENLRSEGSSVVLKTLNGKKLERDTDTHYPNDDSIEDKNTTCQVFFHAHRDNEYGHFHTFINNSNGDLVHLIMISMDEQGRPVELSTLNTWVTGEVYVKAEELKKLFLLYKIDHNLFPDKRIALFIENIFIGYKETIYELFEERDDFIEQYISRNNIEPFEDEDIEVISSKKIEVCHDVLIM